MPMTSVLAERLARTPRTLFFVDGVGALVTAALLIRFTAALHVLDWLYFVGEIVVVWALVTLELRVARAATTEAPTMTTRAPLRRKDHGGATW